MLMSDNLFNIAVRYLVDDNVITEEMLAQSEHNETVKNRIEELALDMILRGVIGDE